MELLAVVLMVLLNGVFAAYEIALASVSVGRLQLLAEQNRGGSAAALAMKHGIEKSLAVVQLGITLAGLAAGATGGACAADDIAPLLRSWGFSGSVAYVFAVSLVVLPLTAATIVLGELIPKLFALRNKEWVCLTLSPMMRMFSLSVWPLVWFLEFSATGLMRVIERRWQPKSDLELKHEAAELQELRAMANMARASQLIGAREEGIILGAARLAVRPVSEIMLAAEYIKMLSIQENLTTNLISAHMDLHTRFPVSEHSEDPQAIVGYVNFKDIVTALRISPTQPSIRGIVRELPSFHAATPIATALESMLRDYTHIALVRDSRSRVVGMLTLEDIVEELVGDIEDEHDQIPMYVIKSGSGWVIGGGAKIKKVAELTGIRLSDQDDQSISAWMIAQIGDRPRGSETIRGDGYSLLVRKVKQARVLEASLILDRMW
jgi:putative hemolysin